MCEFPSWTEKNGEVYFLTDKDVAERESDLSRQKEPADYVGHSAIEIVFKVQGKNKEGFPCHPGVARAIRDGKMNRLMDLGGYKKISINKNGQLHCTDGPAIERLNGTKEWYLKDQRHRTDGPAIERLNGTKEWYLKGQKHRMDGPAIEYSDGAKYWYLNGQLHRTDGPAVERLNGTKFWYLKGQLHRTDGPAIEWSDGTKEWYLNGQRHRTDGPAIEWNDGTKKWYLKGKFIKYESS